MGTIGFAKNNIDGIVGNFIFSSWFIENSSPVYDWSTDNSIVFVKSIEFSESESNIEVCLTTINGETLCFHKTINELALDQIIKITLRTKQNPEPKNNDESKEGTSLWNNFWLFVIFEVIFIISVYTYMTFQKRRALNVY